MLVNYQDLSLISMKFNKQHKFSPRDQTKVSAWS